MRRLLPELSLQVLAGVITLAVMAASAFSLWRDRQAAWGDAERTSRNLVTALARDIGSNLAQLDAALREIGVDVADPGLLALPPLAQHRILFDRVRTGSYMGSVLVLDEGGNAIADAESILPRRFNAGDQDYFRIHQERSDTGLYMGSPFPSRLGNGELSVPVSRRLSHPDGGFAGVITGRIPLSRFDALFRDLDLGPQGSITLLRDDGVVLMRKPQVEGRIGQDLSGTPNVQRFIREGSGSFEGTAAFDRVRRLYVFRRVEGFPLILTISKGVDDVVASWTTRAIAQGIVTLLICAALTGLTILFRRELRRRTRAEARLRHLARTDDLTGLPNRRAFRETYARAWRRAARTNLPLSVLYIDADFFKSFNDLYGHGRGDEALRAVAQSLEANIRRPWDMAARQGGEEFVVLLPDTNAAGAWTGAEAIRKAVVDLDIGHEGSPHQVVTVSIGIAGEQPLPGSTGERLLEEADVALYQAKAAGRNCVRQHGVAHARCEGSGPLRDRAPVAPVGP